MRSNDWHEDEVSTYIAYSHPDIERPLAATRDWRSTSILASPRKLANHDRLVIATRTLESSVGR